MLMIPKTAVVAPMPSARVTTAARKAGAPRHGAGRVPDVLPEWRACGMLLCVVDAVHRTGSAPAVVNRAQCQAPVGRAARGLAPAFFEVAAHQLVDARAGSRSRIRSRGRTGGGLMTSEEFRFEPSRHAGEGIVRSTQQFGAFRFDPVVTLTFTAALRRGLSRGPKRPAPGIRAGRARCRPPPARPSVRCGPRWTREYARRRRRRRAASARTARVVRTHRGRSS